MLSSLKLEDRNRKRRRMRVAVLSCAVVALAGVGFASVQLIQQRIHLQVQRALTPPVDADAWAHRLADLKSKSWREAFSAGRELAAIDPETGWTILRDNWPKIDSIEARQQILKAFVFTATHPHLLDVLDLGMTDSQPAVRGWAGGYLQSIAFQDFTENPKNYGPWRQRTAGRPLDQVVAESARQWAQQLHDNGPNLQINSAAMAANGLRDYPTARSAAIDAGMLETLVDSLTSHPDDSTVTMAVERILVAAKPDESFQKQRILPLLNANQNWHLRIIAAEVMGQKGNSWAVDPLLGVLDESVRADEAHSAAQAYRRPLIWSVATSLGEIGDKRAIPKMIDLIALDNTYDTVYGIGYFGLGKMTGVGYSESHDGKWWQNWLASAGH